MPLRLSVRAECRRGSLGLGPNLLLRPLDLSETGARLVLRDALSKGQEVELLFAAGGARPVKRLAHVIWSLPAEGGHVVGLRFSSCVGYPDVQALAMPPRVMR
jgi:hypothetical protein